MVAAISGEQLALFNRVHPVNSGSILGALRRNVFFRSCCGTARGAGEPDEVSGAAVQDALEVSGDTDRPCQRCGFEPDAVSDLVKEFECIAARAIPLVDHGDDRDATMTTHLKELECLRLQTLRCVDQHDRAIDGAQHPVGVFGEVGVPRSVEQVDDTVLPIGGDVRELQSSGRDRDAPGLLHLHPVRHRRPSPRFTVNGARFGDHPCVQDERFGERRLSRVGMADDSEGPPTEGFARQTFCSCPARGRADFQVVVGHRGVHAICL